jgi:hypothetical protein
MQRSALELLTCLDSASVAESLSVMLEIEKLMNGMKCDYLLANSDGAKITKDDRGKIADYFHSAATKLKIDRDVAASTMGVMDLFLSTASDATAKRALFDRRTFLLVSVAAFCICAKMSTQDNFDNSVFRERFSMGEIMATELSILSALSWRVNAPTSLQMAHHMLSLLSHVLDSSQATWKCILDDVRIQTEDAVKDYFFASQLPSTIAMAAISNALDRNEIRLQASAMSAPPPPLATDSFAALEDLLVVKNRLLALTRHKELNSADREPRHVIC